MRTKALLCAAAVAAFAISAVAQNNVYSLNIVGYVNVTAPGGYSILANPLSAGVTNGANEIMPVTDGEIILTFVNGNYQYYTYDSGNGGWINANGDPSAPPSLPPGVGFWYFNPGATAQTITFVGQVVPGPGVTNSLTLPAGYAMVGSPMPIGGALSATPTTGIPVVPGTVNMPIFDNMVYMPYVNGSFEYHTFDSGNGGWLDANGANTAAPSVAPGQGFFYFNPNAGPAQWQQALP